MRSSSLDFSSFETMTYPGVPPKKMERSHEENQERAYIAASRRTDRSLEARVQSARMASDIHKRRTGKSFRITEEIVQKEEMYEEEDDDLPRSYRVFGPSMQTSSSDMNFRAQAYLSNKVAMSAMLARTNDEWRQNEVNKRFAETFPQHANFDPQPRATNPAPSDQPQQQPHQQPQAQQHQESSPPPLHPGPPQFQQTLPHAEPLSPTQHYYPQPYHSAQYPPQFSPPAMGPWSPEHPAFVRQDSGVGLTTAPHNFDRSPQAESPPGLGSSGSAFTSALPIEARMMMSGADMNQGYEPAPQSWPAVDSSFDMSGVPRASGTDEEQVVSPATDNVDMPNIKWEQMMVRGDDPAWDTFINDGAWADGQ